MKVIHIERLGFLTNTVELVSRVKYTTSSVLPGDAKVSAYEGMHEHTLRRGLYKDLGIIAELVRIKGLAEPRLELERLIHNMEAGNDISNNEELRP